MRNVPHNWFHFEDELSIYRVKLITAPQRPFVTPAEGRKRLLRQGISRPRLGDALQQPNELSQIVYIKIRNGPISHSGNIETDHVMTSPLVNFRLTGLVARGRPDKNIDHMLTVLINYCSDGVPLEIIQPRADERESGVGKIANDWREVQSLRQPRFKCMAVRRGDVSEMVRL